HTFLARLLKLLKHLLSFIDSAWFSLQSYPTFASGHLHAKRVFQGFQELKVISIERLQSAGALKLQGACFRHCLSRAKISAVLLQTSDNNRRQRWRSNNSY